MAKGAYNAQLFRAFCKEKGFSTEKPYGEWYRFIGG
jgi:hypothetical protein